MHGQRLPLSSTYHTELAAHEDELHNKETIQQPYAAQNAQCTEVGTHPGAVGAPKCSEKAQTVPVLDTYTDAYCSSAQRQRSSAEDAEAAAILAQLAAAAMASTVPSPVGAAAAVATVVALLSPGEAAAAGFRPGQDAGSAATAGHADTAETTEAAAAAAGIHPTERLGTVPNLPFSIGAPGSWQADAATAGADAAQAATAAVGSCEPAAAAAVEPSGATSAAAGSKRVRLQVTGSSGRILWTTDLHTAFLDAVQQLGGAEAATPTEILQLMNVDGLSRENVKSHLQKHRQHVREQRLMQQLQQVPLAGIGQAAGGAAAAAAAASAGHVTAPKGRLQGYSKQQHVKSLAGLHAVSPLATHGCSTDLLLLPGDAWQQPRHSPVPAAAAAVPKGSFSRRRRSSSGAPVSSSAAVAAAAAAAAATGPLFSVAAPGAAAAGSGAPPVCGSAAAAPSPLTPVTAHSLRQSGAGSEKPRSLAAASSGVGLQLLQPMYPVGVPAGLVAEAEAAAAAAARGGAHQGLQQVQIIASKASTSSSSSSNDGSRRNTPDVGVALRRQQQLAEPLAVDCINAGAASAAVAGAASAAGAAHPQPARESRQVGATRPSCQQSSLQQQQQLPLHEPQWQQQQQPTWLHMDLRQQLQTARVSLQKEQGCLLGQAQSGTMQHLQQPLCYSHGRIAGGAASDSGLDVLAAAAATATATAEPHPVSVLQMLPQAQLAAVTAAAAGTDRQQSSFLGQQLLPARGIPVAISLAPALPVRLATPPQEQPVMHLSQGACMAAEPARRAQAAEGSAAAATLPSGSQPGRNVPTRAGAAVGENRQEEHASKPPPVHAQPEVSDPAAAAAVAGVSAQEGVTAPDSTSAVALSSVLHVLDSTNRARLATVLQLLTLQGIISWHEPPLASPCAPPAVLGAILQAAVLQQQQQQPNEKTCHGDPAADSH